jgi:hypothetical protein
MLIRYFNYSDDALMCTILHENNYYILSEKNNRKTSAMLYRLYSIHARYIYVHALRERSSGKHKQCYLEYTPFMQSINLPLHGSRFMNKSNYLQKKHLQFTPYLSSGLTLNPKLPSRWKNTKSTSHQCFFSDTVIK